MERKLATIRIISEIKSIPEADLIEVATVDGWKVVIGKGEFKPGDMCVYCEIDSFLPIREEFEFLRKSSYKKMIDREGFRLKTVKMRGQVSQGLVLPLSVLNEFNININVGDDVTEILGIIKYEPPIPADLNGVVKGSLPSFLRKTDEERIENLVNEYEEYKNSGKQFYLTEKADGTSSTYYIKDGVFGVCGRNWEYLEPEEDEDNKKPKNTYWEMSYKYDLKEKMKKFGNICLQGEIVGEGIEGNPYKIKGNIVRFFDAFDINEQKYFGFVSFQVLMAELGLETVPVLDINFKLPNTIDELLLMCNGKSELNPKTDREGIVIRSHDRKVSFKVISKKYLIKHDK